MQTVVETPSYLAEAERLFTPNERRAIVDRLAADPSCGAVIPGGGGIRKVRFGFWRSRQKRRSPDHLSVQREHLPIFVLAMFAKNEKANLSGSERNALGGMATQLVINYQRRK
jgi:hypothetical protein